MKKEIHTSKDRQITVNERKLWEQHKNSNDETKKTNWNKSIYGEREKKKMK